MYSNYFTQRSKELSVVLNVRLLNVSGVEYEIVEENWLKWSVVELK